MDVGIANPAGANLDQDLARIGLRLGNFADFPLAMLCRNNSSFHDLGSFACGGPFGSAGTRFQILIRFVRNHPGYIRQDKRHPTGEATIPVTPGSWLPM